MIPEEMTESNFINLPCQEALGVEIIRKIIHDETYSEYNGAVKGRYILGFNNVMKTKEGPIAVLNFASWGSYDGDALARMVVNMKNELEELECKKYVFIYKSESVIRANEYLGLLMNLFKPKSPIRAVAEGLGGVILLGGIDTKTPAYRLMATAVERFGIYFNAARTEGEANTMLISHFNVSQES